MQRDLIYDLGMHTGQDTAFYLKKGFRVVAIEASPALAEAARHRFRRPIALGRLVVINIGVAASRGVLPFFLNREHAEWSSFNEHLGTQRGPYDVIEVATAPLSDLLAEHGVPYYLKIDIEGCDQVALESLATLPLRPAYLSVESGTVPMLQRLVELGYGSFKFINQAVVKRMRCPWPAREGAYAWHRFPFGASGPFGEETVGDWKGPAEMEGIIADYWARPGLDAAVHGWFDLHARRVGVDSTPAATRGRWWAGAVRALRGGP